MSNKAINLAISLPIKKATSKYLLLVLANFANENFEVFHSAKSLSEVTALNEKTIYSALSDLRERGLIEKTGRFVGSAAVYKLTLSDPKTGVLEDEKEESRHPKTVVLRHPKTVDLTHPKTVDLTHPKTGVSNEERKEVKTPNFGSQDTQKRKSRHPKTGDVNIYKHLINNNNDFSPSENSEIETAKNATIQTEKNATTSKAKNSKTSNSKNAIFSSEAKTLISSLVDDENLINDFVTLRRAKKAPLTVNAIKQLQREAEKAKMPLRAVLEVCCLRGWIGFNHQWLLNGNAAHSFVNGNNVIERPKEWHESNQGIREKAKEMGIVFDDNEPTPMIKAKIDKVLFKSESESLGISEEQRLSNLQRIKSMIGFKTIN